MRTDFESLPVLVLGCGVAGLGAARALSARGVPFHLVEKQDGPGGLVRTDRVGGYLFDRAGHFIHPRTDVFKSVLADSGIRFDTIERRSAVILGDRVVPYPLQFNLWACDAEFAAAVARDIAAAMGGVDPDAGLYEHFEGTWGPTLTESFFRPYLEKMWGRSLEAMPATWGARFVPAADTERVSRGLAGPVLGYGYNASFEYPSSGRIGDLPEALAADMPGAIEFEARVTSIDGAGRRVRLADGRSHRYSCLISTIPLTDLLAMLGRPDRSPYLAYSNLLNIRVGFRGEFIRREHWCYLPDDRLAAFRAGFPGNFSAKVCPPGAASLSLECGLGEGLGTDVPAEEIARQTLDYLARRDVLSWEAIDLVDSHLISPAYIAHRMPVTPYLQRIRRALAAENIHLAGRYGAWDYISLEDAYLSGLEAAERVHEDAPRRSMEQGG